MINIIFGLYNVILESLWTVFQAFTIAIVVLLYKKRKISEYQIPKLGFLLLFISMLSTLARQDYIAGKIAEYVWILFSTSLVIHFVRKTTKASTYENK